MFTNSCLSHTSQNLLFAAYAEHYRDPQPQRIKDCGWYPTPNDEFTIQPPHLRLTENHGKRKEIERGRGAGHLLVDCIF